MEYCEGSLKKSIDSHRKLQKVFREQDIRRVLVDILQALSELHSIDIVHLDIKPDNILISQKGTYKLSDFGLSRRIELLCGEDITEGDSRYIPREILNNSNADEVPDLTKADIFSLGITIFQLISL